MDEMESKTLAIYKLERYTICINGADFSISVPVSRNSSPKQGDFCRIFGSFCYFLRRWDLIDQNGLQKNDQYKIWNKIGHKTWTFEKQFFDFLKKNDRVWTDLADQNQKNGDISGSSGQNLNRFFLSDSTSKNISKKVGDIKFRHTPTHLEPKHAISKIRH